MYKIESAKRSELLSSLYVNLQNFARRIRIGVGIISIYGNAYKPYEDPLIITLQPVETPNIIHLFKSDVWE